MHTATAFIDRQALFNNVDVIRQKAPNCKIVAVLKANAYGHGLERLATMLASKAQCIDAFGVARLDEAIALRAAGIDNAIVLLEGFFSSDELNTLAENQLETIIHNREQLSALMAAKLSQPIKVWLKIDTGMHRLGIEPREFSEFYQALTASKNVVDEITLMTHLSCADDQTSEITEQQLTQFNVCAQAVNAPRSIANSAGICAWPNSHGDWVRPGIMLYGVSPLMNKSAADLTLQPVMTLQSSLITVRQLKAGQSVGYGASWQTEQDTTIGVVAVGYGDGYPRHAKSGTPVLINGRIVPLVGRVSMDMITVDLGNKAIDKVGDIATLWGQGLAIEAVAECAETIAYELLCNISRRVKIVEN
ncbi:MAG: alanine racemase [Thalassotalea sp.]